MFLDQRRKSHDRNALNTKQFTLVQAFLEYEFEDRRVVPVHGITPSDPLWQLVLFDEVRVYVVHVDVTVVV